MPTASHPISRFIRFVVWAVITLTMFLAVIALKPHQTFIVPCVSVVLFVPIVLLPKPTRKR